MPFHSISTTPAECKGAFVASDAATALASHAHRHHQQHQRAEFTQLPPCFQKGHGPQLQAQRWHYTHRTAHTSSEGYICGAACSQLMSAVAPLRTSETSSSRRRGSDHLCFKHMHLLQSINQQKTQDHLLQGINYLHVSQLLLIHGILERQDLNKQSPATLNGHSQNSKTQNTFALYADLLHDLSTISSSPREPSTGSTRNSAVVTVLHQNLA
jgi:hypothetical protein